MAIRILENFETKDIEITTCKKKLSKKYTLNYWDISTFLNKVLPVD